MTSCTSKAPATTSGGTSGAWRRQATDALIASVVSAIGHRGAPRYEDLIVHTSSWVSAVSATANMTSARRVGHEGGEAPGEGRLTAETYQRRASSESAKRQRTR